MAEPVGNCADCGKELDLALDQYASVAAKGGMTVRIRGGTDNPPLGPLELVGGEVICIPCSDERLREQAGE